LNTYKWFAANVGSKVGDGDVGLTDGESVMIVGIKVGCTVVMVVGCAVGSNEGDVLKNFKVTAPFPVTPPC
jgi:hypothetical protein